MDVRTITEALDFSRNYWSAVENDRTLIAVEKLELLFELMGFDQTERAELLELRRVGKARGWWSDFSANLDDGIKRFLGLESGATSIRTFESNLVPGLMQVPEYARAILESDPARSQLEIDDHLAARKRRQLRVTGPEPVRFTAVLSEACLVQQVAGPEIQKKQLQHILALVEQHPETLEVRVVPFTVNPGFIANSSTLLFLDFDSAHLPTIAWQEAIRTMDEAESGDEEFRRLELSWNQGLERSSDRGQSAAIIGARLAELS